MAIKFSDLFNNVDDQRLEEVLNKTRDVAEEMGKKSAERIELSRKKIELIDAKAKLTKLYEKFGRMNYDRYIGLDVDDAELDNIACQIAEQKNKIDIYTQDIEIAKQAFNESMASVAKKTREAFAQEKEVVEVSADDVEVVDSTEE